MKSNIFACVQSKILSLNDTATKERVYCALPLYLLGCMQGRCNGVGKPDNCLGPEGCPHQRHLITPQKYLMAMCWTPQWQVWNPPEGVPMELLVLFQIFCWTIKHSFVLYTLFAISSPLKRAHCTRLHFTIRITLQYYHCCCYYYFYHYIIIILSSSCLLLVIILLYNATMYWVFFLRC